MSGFAIKMPKPRSGYRTSYRSAAAGPASASADKAAITSTTNRIDTASRKLDLSLSNPLPEGRLDALQTGVGAERLARYFEYWLLRLQGVYPSTQACPQCGASLQGGAVLEPRSHWYLCRQCGSHAQGVVMPAAALQFLAEAASVAPGKLGDVTVSSEALVQLAAAHRLLLVWHLDREPRAARVLREINP